MARCDLSQPGYVEMVVNETRRRAAVDQSAARPAHSKELTQSRRAMKSALDLFAAGIACRASWRKSELAA